MRERFQHPDALDHGLRHSSRGFRTAFCNVVADPFEIIRSVRRPADAHQPRYRRSMRAATSSCSSSLPSRAATRPFSTSARNHSSWSIRRGQQLERYLVDGATGLGRQTRQLRFKFRRNLQVHETSVGCLDSAVNRRVHPATTLPCCEITLNFGWDVAFGRACNAARSVALAMALSLRRVSRERPFAELCLSTSRTSIRPA